jgi:hypothetical protein
MLRQFRPELGDKQKSEILAVYGALTNKFKLYTNIELKGQGIKVDDATGKNNNLNKPSYWVTVKAFEKLCNKYDIDQELLLN